MFYYAITDELGVLCVDQVDEHTAATEQDVARLAEHYPDAIYFAMSESAVKRSLRRIYRLTHARQAGHGIETDRPGWFETLRESFGEYDLSDEVGRAAEQVGYVAGDATYEARWNTLARLEGIPSTWAEQKAVRDADLLADEELFRELDEQEGEGEQ